MTFDINCDIAKDARAIFVGGCLGVGMGAGGGLFAGITASDALTPMVYLFSFGGLLSLLIYKLFDFNDNGI